MYRVCNNSAVPWQPMLFIRKFAVSSLSEQPFLVGFMYILFLPSELDEIADQQSEGFQKKKKKKRKETTSTSTSAYVIPIYILLIDQLEGTIHRYRVHIIFIWTLYIQASGIFFFLLFHLWSFSTA